jgi:hypothetical protein
MNEATTRYLDDRHNYAWWYACGRNDERRGQPPGVRLEYVDPDRFAAFARREAEPFFCGATFHLASIQDQFEAYKRDDCVHA